MRSQCGVHHDWFGPGLNLCREDRAPPSVEGVKVPASSFRHQNDSEDHARIGLDTCSKSGAAGEAFTDRAYERGWYAASAKVPGALLKIRSVRLGKRSSFHGRSSSRRETANVDSFEVMTR
jgi:hypothetical protein